MPPQAVSHALEFIYTGRLNKRAGLHLASLEQVTPPPPPHIRWYYFNWSNFFQVAKLLELPLLVEYLNNLRNKEEFLNADLTTKVWESLANWSVCLNQNSDDRDNCSTAGRCRPRSTPLLWHWGFLFPKSFHFSILKMKKFFYQFALDDGVVNAHKPLLMARCDMMQVEQIDMICVSCGRILYWTIDKTFNFRRCFLTASSKAPLAVFAFLVSLVPLSPAFSTFSTQV